MSELTPATKVVLFDRLERRVKAAKDTAKAHWSEGARAGQRDVAALGDADLGTVTMTKGRETWKHVDPAATLAWAKEHAPHLVETREVIPDGHLAALKKEPITPDGEIIPGFEPVVGDPYPSVRAAKDVDAVIESAVQAGLLNWDEVLELEQ